MKQFFLLLIAGFFTVCLSAQDPQELMAEAKRLEQQFKDAEALAKYKQALVLQPSLLPAIVKSAELTLTLAEKQTALPEKQAQVEQAMRFATAALKVDSNSAEANYITAVVYGELTDVETKKEKIFEYVKLSHDYAQKATELNKNFGKGWHAYGKWHLEMLQLNAIKKAAVKLLAKSVPDGNLELAIASMERCATLEPYYCTNFLDLAKAYHLQKKYEKAIATLERLAKLPTRRSSDIAVKAEGKTLLQKLQ